MATNRFAPMSPPYQPFQTPDLLRSDGDDTLLSPSAYRFHNNQTYSLTSGVEEFKESSLDGGRVPGSEYYYMNNVGYAVSGNQWPGYGSEDTEDFAYLSTMGDGEVTGGYHHSDTNSDGANRVHVSLDKQAFVGGGGAGGRHVLCRRLFFASIYR